MLDTLQVIQQQAAFQTPLYPDVYEETVKLPFDRPLKIGYTMDSGVPTGESIGYTMDSPVGTPVSDDAKKAVQKVLRWLESEGHHVEEVDNGVDGIQLMRNYFLMNSGEISSLVQELEEMMQKERSEEHTSELQ